MQYIEYPSIKGYQEAKREIYNTMVQAGSKEPVVFVGTVKLHGSNFSLIYDTNSTEITFQSRNKALSGTDKFFNYESISFPQSPTDTCNLAVVFTTFFTTLFTLGAEKGPLAKLGNPDQIAVFGELIGGTIQPGVALEKLPLQFVVFDVCELKAGKRTYLSHEELIQFGEGLRRVARALDAQEILSCITHYPHFTVSIDAFSEASKQQAQTQLSNTTASVEAQCPVALAKGVSGTGEGVVWRSIGAATRGPEGFGIRFKVKGDEHTNSKVRTLNPANAAKALAAQNLEEVCQAVCTDARMKQGLHYLRENDTPEKDRKSTFMRWVVEDTLKEESDFLREKGYAPDQLKAKLFEMALNFWRFNAQGERK
jgi:hypothetical protein